MSTRRPGLKFALEVLAFYLIVKLTALRMRLDKKYQGW